MKSKPKSKSNGKQAQKAAPTSSEVAEVTEPLSVSNSVAHAGTRIGPVYVDGLLHLSPFDLTRYELAQARVINAYQTIGLHNAEMEKAKREFEEKARNIHAAQQTAQGTAKQYEEALRGLQEELMGLYKVDFSQATYDEVSGKISVLGEPVPEPSSTPTT